MKFSKGIAAIVGASAAAVAYAWLAPAVDATHRGRHQLTSAGKLKLRLWRLLYGATTARKSKQSTMPLRAMYSVGAYKIPTRYGTVPVTIYRPFHDQQPPLPVYFNFHEGGFVFRNAEQDDRLCRYIADQVSCLVVNVDYSVAPESSFPRPVHEGFDAVRWVVEHQQELGIDEARVAVGGQSAGGNIAAAVALMNRDEHAFSLKLQIMNYPALDLSLPVEQKNLLPYRKQMINQENAALFNTAYVPMTDARVHPLASPVYAESLEALPPALITTAQFDLLKPDGERYAALLREQQVPVTYQEFAGVDHGFTQSGTPAQIKASWELIVNSLKEAFKR